MDVANDAEPAAFAPARLRYLHAIVDHQAARYNVAPTSHVYRHHMHGRSFADSHYQQRYHHTPFRWLVVRKTVPARTRELGWQSRAAYLDLRIHRREVVHP